MGMFLKHGVVICVTMSSERPQIGTFYGLYTINNGLCIIYCFFFEICYHAQRELCKANLNLSNSQLFIVINILTSKYMRKGDGHEVDVF